MHKKLHTSSSDYLWLFIIDGINKCKFFYCKKSQKNHTHIQIQESQATKKQLVATMLKLRLELHVLLQKNNVCLYFKLYTMLLQAARTSSHLHLKKNPHKNREQVRYSILCLVDLHLTSSTKLQTPDQTFCLLLPSQLCYFAKNNRWIVKSGDLSAKKLKRVKISIFFFLQNTFLFA